jgi:hypothetical protein
MFGWKISSRNLLNATNAKKTAKNMHVKVKGCALSGAVSGAAIKAANGMFVLLDVLLNAATQRKKGNIIGIVGIGWDVTARWSQEREDSKLILGGTLDFYTVELVEEYYVRLLSMDLSLQGSYLT